MAHACQEDHKTTGSYAESMHVEKAHAWPGAGMQLRMDIQQRLRNLAGFIYRHEMQYQLDRVHHQQGAVQVADEHDDEAMQ